MAQVETMSAADYKKLDIPANDAVVLATAGKGSRQDAETEAVEAAQRACFAGSWPGCIPIPSFAVVGVPCGLCLLWWDPTVMCRAEWCGCSVVQCE